MSVSQSNRDSLCSTAESDCSALSAASDSVAVQRHALSLRAGASHHGHAHHEPQTQMQPVAMRHSLANVAQCASVRELQRDAFLFQPIPSAAHAHAHPDPSGVTGDGHIPLNPRTAANLANQSSNTNTGTLAPATDPNANANAPHSSTSTPFSGYFSASSSASLPSLVGAPSLRQRLPADSQPQTDNLTHAHAPAAVSNSASASGSAITSSSSAELDNVMTASTSSAPTARADPNANSRSVGTGPGASASADVLLIRPTPIKAAAAACTGSDSASTQSLVQQPKATPAGGAFTHVTSAAAAASTATAPTNNTSTASTATSTATNTVYEGELCNMMQRTALSQLPNNDNHRVPHSGRAIARVRRSRTPSQPTSTSPPRCSSQPSDAQQPQQQAASCACARSAQPGVIEFADGACGACSIAAARAAGRKRRWRRRPAENSSSFECEPGSLSDASQQHSQADTDSPSSDCDDELETSANAKVTDSPARCDSKCRKRYAAAEVRPSINAEKMLTVVSQSDLHADDTDAEALASRSGTENDSFRADVHVGRRERPGRHAHATHKRPVSQVFERAFAPHAGTVVGVHPSFSLMENQLAALASSTSTSASDPPTLSSLLLCSDQSESDDDELLEAASCAFGGAVCPTVTPLAVSIPVASGRLHNAAPESEAAIRELDIEQIENN